MPDQIAATLPVFNDHNPEAPLTLDIGSGDGYLFIALRDGHSGIDLKGRFEADQIPQLIDAFHQAMTLLASDDRPDDAAPLTYADANAKRDLGRAWSWEADTSAVRPGTRDGNATPVTSDSQE